MKYLIVQFDQILKQTILIRSNINFQFVHVEYDCLIEKQSFPATMVHPKSKGIYGNPRYEPGSSQVNTSTAKSKTGINVRFTRNSDLDVRNIKHN